MILLVRSLLFNWFTIPLVRGIVLQEWRYGIEEFQMRFPQVEGNSLNHWIVYRTINLFAKKLYLLMGWLSLEFLCKITVVKAVKLVS